MKSAYYLTITQDQNLGDLLINKVLIDELAYNNIIYLDSKNLRVHFSEEIKSNPNVIDIYEKFGLSLKKGGRLFKTFRFINKHQIKDFYVSPGPRTMNGLLDLTTLAVLMIFCILKLQKINIWLIGCDFSFMHISNKLYNNVIVKLAKKVFLRDIISIKSLDKPNVDYIPDLAFLYNKYVTVSEETKSNTILISFRAINDRDDQLINSLDEIIKYYSANKYKILFFYQVECDAVFNRHLYQIFKDKYHNVFFREELLWYNDIQKFYGKARIVLSNRLHVLLLGIINHCKSVGIVDDRESTKKISKIFYSLNFNNIFQYNTPNIIDQIANCEIITNEIIEEQCNTISKLIKSTYNE